MSEESGLDSVARWELLVHWDLEAKRLGVDIANIDTTLVSEEDIVAITIGVDTDVEFAV